MRHQDCVKRVAFEIDSPKAFDDIAVYYDPPIRGTNRLPVSADYFQVKWHATYSGSFGYADLADPAFINAKSVSLLQRLRDARTQFAPDGQGARFFFVTTSSINGDDPLGLLVSPNAGEILVDKLFDGTTANSKFGRVRKTWREHLELKTDEELRTILELFYIKIQPWTLESQKENLNLCLANVGLQPVNDDQTPFIYDDLYRKLLGQGVNEFDRESLWKVFEEEGLLLEEKDSNKREPRESMQILGIRSFLRLGASMEEETDEYLCLVRHFQERYIKEEELWQEAVLPEVNDFLVSTLPQSQRTRLILDTHSSIAFACGTIINMKAGTEVELVQQVHGKTHVWSSLEHGQFQMDGLRTQEVLCASGGQDLALAVGLTHSVLPDVEGHVRRFLPTVGRIQSFEPENGPSQNSVQDGVHAFKLAEHVVNHIRLNRPAAEIRGTIHLFASAPNSFFFFLGQQQKALGMCLTYEWDFDWQGHQGYQKSLNFP